MEFLHRLCRSRSQTAARRARRGRRPSSTTCYCPFRNGFTHLRHYYFCSHMISKKPLCFVLCLCALYFALVLSTLSYCHPFSWALCPWWRRRTSALSKQFGSCTLVVRHTRNPVRRTKCKYKERFFFSTRQLRAASSTSFTCGK